MTIKKLELAANAQGIWLSALSDDFSQNDVFDLLQTHGVRQYDLRAIEEFVRAKGKAPVKLAARSPVHEKDAKILVNLSKDNMLASVSFEAPFFTKPWPTEDEVLEALSSKSVVFGVDREAVKDVVKRRETEDYVVVARGMPPIQGTDAIIEMIIDPDKPIEVGDDEKVDFWNRSALVTVRTGDKVAVKHPLVPGTDGKTVVGTPMKAAAVKDVNFSAGEGLATAEGDALSLIATMDGQLKRKNGKLVVLPELEIRGDVDFGVGSVDFTGAVRISGSVHDGFRVIAGGSIEIHGMVEAADIESQADVIVNGGIRGMNKGEITSEGSVAIGFVDQATIRSGHTVTVKKAVLHSRIFAQDSVLVMGSGSKSQIAGGRVEAGVEVACHVLGSEMGTKTEVIVGLPPQKLERRRILQTEITQFTENLNKLEPNLAFLKKLESNGQLDDQKRTMQVSLTKMIFQLQASLASVKEELKELDAKLDDMRDKGIVRVKEVCYPGVQLSIRGVPYVVKEVCKYSSFVVENGSVVLKPFDYKHGSSKKNAPHTGG